MCMNVSRGWPMYILRCVVYACLRFYTPESQNDYVLIEWMNVRFYPIFPDFQRTVSFWKVSRLRPFVVQVRAASRWRWAWSIDGKNLGLRCERLAANRLVRADKPLARSIHCCPSFFLFLMPDHRLCIMNNMYIQGVTRGTDQTSGGCSLC